MKLSAEKWTLCIVLHEVLETVQNTSWEEIFYARNDKGYGWNVMWLKYRLLDLEQPLNRQHFLSIHSQSHRYQLCVISEVYELHINTKYYYLIQKTWTNHCPLDPDSSDYIFCEGLHILFIDGHRSSIDKEHLSNLCSPHTLWRSPCMTGTLFWLSFIHNIYPLLQDELVE